MNFVAWKESKFYSTKSRNNQINFGLSQKHIQILQKLWLKEMYLLVHYDNIQMKYSIRDEIEPGPHVADKHSHSVKRVRILENA